MNDNDAPTFSASENGLIINEPMTTERVGQDTSSVPEPPKTEKTKSSKIAKLIASLVVLGLIAFAATQIDYAAIRDNITAIGYEMSPELASIVDDIKLTRDGERILMGTRPELQDAENFNESCGTLDDGTATLGCYKENRIYVYNITRSELHGIRQVTLAHELLHAVWARMNDSERSALHDSLQSLYDSDSDIKKHLDLYSSSDFYDELHSVVGSQVSPQKMPEPLQKHFAKYFTDQAKIADFYDNYNSLFKVATERMEVLKVEIAEHRETIKTQKEEYELMNFELTNDVNDFNARARNGSFASIEEFNNERQALLQRQNVLKEKYQEIINNVTEANQLINEYNSNIARKTELYRSIDSTIDQPDSPTEE